MYTVSKSLEGVLNRDYSILGCDRKTCERNKYDKQKIILLIRFDSYMLPFMPVNIFFFLSHSSTVVLSLWHITINNFLLNSECLKMCYIFFLLLDLPNTGMTFFSILSRQHLPESQGLVTWPEKICTERRWWMREKKMCFVISSLSESAMKHENLFVACCNVAFGCWWWYVDVRCK